MILRRTAEKQKKWKAKIGYGILIQRIHVPRSMRGKTKFSDRRTHLCGLTKVFFIRYILWDSAGLRLKMTEAVRQQSRMEYKR